MQKLSKHYLVVLIPFIKEIYEIIHGLITNNLQQMNLDVFDLISKLSVSVLLVVLITMILKIKKKIDALDKYSDNTHDSIMDIVDLHETINRRKTNYLFDLLKPSNLYRPYPNKNVLSDFEKQLLLKLSEKRQKEINEAINDFNEERK